MPEDGFRKILASSPYVYLIGVAGDSGSGKTTFTAAIRRLIGDDMVTTITLDDYHLFGREERKARDITPLSPLANDLHRLEQDVAALKGGRTISKMVYNHTAGNLEGPVSVSPSPVIILEGLHALFSERLRQLLDFSIYVDPATDVKKEWKLKRDRDDRGYTPGEVREEMARRENDYRTFIAPQRQHARAIISIRFSKYGRDLGWSRDIYRIALKMDPLPWTQPDVSFRFDLGSLLSLPGRSCSIEFLPVSEGETKRVIIQCDGIFPPDVADPLICAIRKETGKDPMDYFRSTTGLIPTELVQLLICWKIILHRRAIPDLPPVRDTGKG
ncbi:MAG: phosphoribulokinase [Methanolinea sp.]|nr:phosphoribulokinase [Methanolinea sp.]